MDLQWAPVVYTAVCGVGATVLLVKWVRHHQVQKKIQRARSRRDAGFSQARRAVQDFKEKNPGLDLNPIMGLSLDQLTKEIKAGSLKPAAVLHAYMDKALELGKTLNCNTGVLMESLTQLSEIESHKDGLLYGIPISIKENIGYKGHDSTCGLLCKLDDPELLDSVVVTVLKKQGAIPFIKTNVPQGLLNYECSNPIYGMAVNPRNLKKTCGGSSGGEGSLIGGGGSILGLGTDIGGSIRIPASFCGICGLKPTSNRISMRGVSSSVKGIKSVHSSIGPMGRDVESLALCMKALLCKDMFSLDPTVPPIPFNQQVYESSDPLRIGYYENDGFMQPSPSMARALRETKKLLEQAGHTLVPFKPPEIYNAMNDYITKGALADGGGTLLKMLKGGPVDPCLQPQILPYSLPNFVKKFLSIVLRPIYPRIAKAMDATRGFKSIEELWKHHFDIENYVHEVMTQWNALELDALLCPALGPAYNFYFCGKLNSALSYTAMYNLLNFPAGVVPVSTVTAADEAQLNDYKGNFGDIWDKLFVKAVRGGEGLPVAVQCVSLPWQEEMCLRLMREVEKVHANKKLSSSTH
ncbi:fatty-acid amide hydrolase 1 [Astyanax mexicanus]|uniref:Fatty-acid amide hydrolase 1 n=1 Tax=Astyanax mexicanus TaxID=7994 RepID=W5KZR9_ASTMX|nr:fatty-acid amide hydrolase 1 [Astyanax mexicanus]